MKQKGEIICQTVWVNEKNWGIMILKKNVTVNDCIKGSRKKSSFLSGPATISE